MSRDFSRRYWQAYVERDYRTLGNLRARGWFNEFPQSGERIRGNENDRLIHEHYPGYPVHVLSRALGTHQERSGVSPFGPVRLFGNQDLWLLEAILEYPTEGRYHAICILELRDDRAVRETNYFARPFEAPDWRKPWTESTVDEEGIAERQLTSESGNEEVHAAALNRYVDAFARGDVTSMLKELASQDFVAHWPQSGERIRGVESYIAIIDHHPSGPSLKSMRRMLGSQDLFVLELLIEEGGQPWHEVSVFEFRGNKVAKKTDYFAEPFEAPAWREQLVERF